MKSTDDSFIKQVTAGYISEDGEPIKCECGCTEFKRVNMYFEEGYLVEYTLECINEKCLKLVGVWSYGGWMI